MITTKKEESKMKHSKILISSCAVAAVMFSLNINAATRTDGLKACAEAAVTELGMQENASLDYSLSADTTTSGIRLKRREMFHLDITNPDDDSVVSRIDCVVDRKARVKNLIEVPIDGDSAIVRANRS
jgi:hypothetical protein